MQEFEENVEKKSETKKETKTEQLARELREKKAKELELYQQNQMQVMGKGVPYISAGAVWAGLALLTNIYRMKTFIFVSLISILVGYFCKKTRDKQVKNLPPAPEVIDYTDEIANKLHSLSEIAADRAKLVKNKEMNDALLSIAVTLKKMAEDVEKNPNDRNKVRKLANYYGDMLFELVDKFINFENNKEAAPEGETIKSSMDKILMAVKGADQSLKQLFDDLFTIDALEINADINTLDKLMQLELAENNKK